MNTSWYALCVKPRHERVTSSHLISRGIEEFTPLYRAKRRWSDRIKEIELPVFPGYVFCRFSAPQKREVLTAPGVKSIAGFGSVPAPVGDDEIAAIRAIVASAMRYGPWPYLRTGDMVRIEAGCLKGMCGTLVRVRDEMRVVVNVELLRRAVAVEIDRDLISAVS